MRHGKHKIEFLLEGSSLEITLLAQELEKFLHERRDEVYKKVKLGEVRIRFPETNPAVKQSAEEDPNG